MLSGCGKKIEDLVNPGSKPASTPKDYGVVWLGNRFSEEATFAAKFLVFAFCLSVACPYVL
jgi:hypothetical protein